MSDAKDVTRQQYAEAFEREAAQSYDVIDKLEREYGYAIDKTFLLGAAAVLACPVKINAPNWQHGRVLYTLLRFYLDQFPGGVCALDIGTAKGFSAVCMAKAVDDARREAKILSVDVIEPDARIRRNSVLEVAGNVVEFHTIDEFTQPFLTYTRPHFVGGGSRALLAECFRQDLHIGFAFVDGKHNYEEVEYEVRALQRLQRIGDYIVFDDANLPPVFTAISRCSKWYKLRRVNVLPKRAYVIAERFM